MNEPEINTTEVSTESESQPELPEWVTPKVEEFTLKEALTGVDDNTRPLDGPNTSS
jgi:hypothetical protein